MKRANIKYLLICLPLIVSLIVGASCTFISGIPANSPPLPDTEESSSPAPTATPPAAIPVDPDWTSPPSQNNTPLPDFVTVVAKVKPSVVVIKTDGGAGSGWIISEDGIIVTNNHVVAGAQTITITLDDGRTFPSEIVRTDPFTDLAVVKIDTQNLPAADIGDSSKLKVGEWVLAIGNSLDLGVTPSEGIVRSLEASVPVSAGETLGGLIGTDAAINPGNSGGPLVNMAGEVIGITSAKIASVGVEGMGYAISINDAKEIIDQLIVNGYVIRTYLGVGLSDVNPLMAFWYSLAVDKGAFVITVAPGSPADEAGLKENDIVVSLDDEEIVTAQELINGIHARQIGQEVKIVYWRGDNKNTTYVTLTESPPPS